MIFPWLQNLQPYELRLISTGASPAASITDLPHWTEISHEVLPVLAFYESISCFC